MGKSRASFSGKRGSIGNEGSPAAERQKDMFPKWIKNARPGNLLIGAGRGTVTLNELLFRKND